LGNFEEDVIIGSRTPINNFSFDENLGEISFEVMNPQQDYNSISIYPGKILSPPYTVMVDGKIHDDVLIVDDITTGDTIVSFVLDSPIRKVSLKGTLDNSLFKTEDGRSQPIPNWIRNNADWWAQGAIGDSDFVSGIQYLIKEEIMIIPQTAKVEGGGSKEIPSWIKNNADWWAQGLISDDDFLKGIQYLVEQGIIQV